MSYQLNFTLPVSGKQVVLTSPPYGIRKEIKRMSKDLKLDDEEIGLVLLSKITEIDGKKMEHYDEFDEMEFNDVLYISAQFNNWKDQKNELPTK